MQKVNVIRGFTELETQNVVSSVLAWKIHETMWTGFSKSFFLSLCLSVCHQYWLFKKLSKAFLNLLQSSFTLISLFNREIHEVLMRSRQWTCVVAVICLQSSTINDWCYFNLSHHSATKGDITSFFLLSTSVSVTAAATFISCPERIVRGWIMEKHECVKSFIISFT